MSESSKSVYFAVLVGLLLVMPVFLPLTASMVNHTRDPKGPSNMVELTDGWLDGWLYRKSHLIAGGDDAPSGFQMRFVMHFSFGIDNLDNVYCNWKCSSNFGDIRFTSSDGVTEYSYWLQSHTAGEKALFWVRVSESLDVNRTIYIYYGNALASTTSNGHDTFDFYEDFARDDSETVGANWVEDEDGTSVSIEDEMLRISGSQSRYTHIEHACPEHEYLVLEGKIFSNSSEMGDWATTIALYWGPHNWVRIGWRSAWVEIEPEFFFEQNEGTGAYGLGHGTPAASGGRWYYFRIQLTSSTTVGHHTDDVYEWDSLPFGWSRPEKFAGPPSHIIIGRGYSDSEKGFYPNPDLDNSDTELVDHVTSYADDIFVRKYCVNTPEHDVYGIEEEYVPDDSTPPSISHPENVTIAHGTTGRNITWTCSDDNPYGYVIFNNKSIANYGEWTTSPIEIVFELDGLAIGIHNITLLIRDTAENMAFDTVWVKITDTDTTATVTPDEDRLTLTLLIAGGVIGAVVVIAVLVLRAREKP